MVYGAINPEGGRALKWLKGYQKSEDYIETVQEIILDHHKFDKRIHTYYKD